MPLNPASTRRRATYLPPDVLMDAGRRLTILSGAIAAVAILYQLLGFLEDHVFGWGADTAVETSANGVTFLMSVGVLALARSGRVRPDRLLDIGLVYEILIALNVSLMETDVLRMNPGARPMALASWVCVLIVLFPVLVPAPPLKTLAISLLAAAMAPLAYWVEPPSPPLTHHEAFHLFLPPFIVAFLALAPSAVVFRLGRDLGRAREVGAYELGALLGKGGMGEVWEGKHRLLARPAAVKLISPEALGSAGPAGLSWLKRFELEARATAGLTSPHTVTLYDYGTTDEGVFYYVMELLDGLDMETLVDRFGPVPPGRAIYLLRQACASLEEAHQRGLVHRDIKPANIYVCRVGCVHDFVKILDFGLVKSAGPETARDPHLSAADMVYGTPAFMAPEQAMGSAVDCRADIYALACVAYWLVTGRLVFDAPTSMGYMMEHIGSAPTPPSQRGCPDIPPAFEQLIMDCLDKTPSRRPQDTRTMRQRLEACQSDAPWTADEAAAWWGRWEKSPMISGT